MMCSLDALEDADMLVDLGDKADYGTAFPVFGWARSPGASTPLIPFPAQEYARTFNATLAVGAAFEHRHPHLLWTGTASFQSDHAHHRSRLVRYSLEHPTRATARYVGLGAEDLQAAVEQPEVAALFMASQ